MKSNSYVSNKLKIAIIGNIVTSGSSEVFLRKYLRVLSPLSGSIYVITNCKSQFSDNRVKMITSLPAITKLSFEQCSAFAKLARFLVVQLTTCVILLGPARYSQVIFVFPIPMVLPVLLAKSMRKKVIIRAAGKVRANLFPKETLKEIFLTNAVELAKHIVFTLSDHIEMDSKSLVYWLNLSRYENKLYVGSKFVDTDVFAFYGDVNNRRNLVGYIGDLSEFKGIKQLVKSIPLILEKDYRVEFLIGGGGSSYTEIRRMILESKLSNKVKMMGWIPNCKVHEYLNRLKLLVLPSFSEGLPNIILEAMACGTVVLATAVGGVPDIVKDGKTGFIIEDNSPKCIAENTLRALSHPDLTKIAKNAREFVEKEFAYRATVEKYREILNVVLEQ